MFSLRYIVTSTTKLVPSVYSRVHYHYDRRLAIIFENGEHILRVDRENVWRWSVCGADGVVVLLVGLGYAVLVESVSKISVDHCVGLETVIDRNMTWRVRCRGPIYLSGCLWQSAWTICSGGTLTCAMADGSIGSCWLNNAALVKSVGLIYFNRRATVLKVYVWYQGKAPRLCLPHLSVEHLFNPTSFSLLQYSRSLNLN